jgi:hypothetical protein
MALKDLSDFKSQYALHKNMQLLTEALTAVQNPAGQPLIPNGEGTPMGNLIRQLNLQEPVQAPPYDFELDENVTLNEIIHQCNIRNINQFDVIQNLGSRSFYDHTYGVPPAVGQPHNNPWREYSRPEAAEKSVEMAQVTCYDGGNTTVNWTETMPKLKTLFQSRVYTNDMAKTCLMNLVHKFHPEQAILLRTMTANQIATHLLQLDSNRDKRTYHRMLLFKSVRTPEEDLPAALAKVQLMIDAIYPANDPAYAAHRSSTFRTALLSFCHDTIAAGVLDKIQRHQLECLPLTDDEIRDFAVRYENYMHLRPTTNLVFGRNFGSTPAATFIQLNSLNAAAANTIYPAYPAYPSPFANPYPAYPQYEDIPANRPGINHNPLEGGQQQGQNAPILGNHLQQAHQMPQAQQMLPNGLNPFANFQHQGEHMLPVQRLMLPFEQPPVVAPNLTQHQGQVPQMPAPKFGMPQPPMPQAQAPLQRNTADHYGPRENHPGMDNSRPYQLNSPLESSTPKIEQSLRDLANRLPSAELQAKSPLSEFYFTPQSCPPKVANNKVASDSSSSTLGNEDGWNLSHIPNPTKVIDFNELPTNAKTFTQMQRRLAQVGKEVVLVKNHPEDITPPNLIEQIARCVLSNTTPNKEKAKKPPKNSEPPRKSSREKRHTELFQAGFNSIQAGINSLVQKRGYVDSSGRYRSYSRDRTESRPSSSAGTDSRPGSRPDSRTGFQTNYRSSSYNRSLSNGRSKSPHGYGNKKEYSQNRSKSPMYSSVNRQGRTPFKVSYRSSDRSSSARRTYPLMQKGINCRSDYDPYKTKNCTKCLKPGHHEFECARYSRYCEKKCSFCHKMNHHPQECKEIKDFPPTVATKN